MGEAFRAHAQERSLPSTPRLTPQDRVLARQLFEQGVEESRKGNWASAREYFERVYALTRRIEVLLNLATAQAESGLLVEAVDSYHHFLQEAGSELRTKYGTQAREAVEQLLARIPRLRIVAQLKEKQQITLDGEALEEAHLNVDLPINPGDHEVVLLENGQVLARQKIQLAEKEHRSVELKAQEETQPKAVAPKTLQPALSPSDKQSEGIDEGLMIAGISGAVLVVGGVVLAIALASSSSSEAPYR
ncbi:MAG: hypothetical protein N2515_02555, partial [Deltaproteobacteria bacterium]|nr:hypothetical protein [Deltaproteobacteria bacterium]